MNTLPAHSLDQQQSLYRSLALLQEADPGKHLNLKAHFEAATNISPTNYKMSLYAVENHVFAKTIQRYLNCVPEAQQATAFLKINQKRIRELSQPASPQIESLDLAKRSSTNLVAKFFKHKNLEDLHNEMSAICQPFAIRKKFEREPKTGKVESRFPAEEDLDLIDTLVIMGNNDLHQINHLSSLIRSTPSFKETVIYIAGFGGYGTTSGPVFCHTEAETIKQRLIDLGSPANKIFTETESTSSLQNIEFLDNLFSSTGANPKHILLSGTPPALLRQSQLFITHSKTDWRSVTTIPPDDLSAYYQTEEEAYVNSLFALREICNALSTFLNERFSPYLPLDKDAFTTSFSLLCNYYSELTGKSPSFEIQPFIDSCLSLWNNEKNGFKLLPEELNAQLTPIYQSLSSLFTDASSLWMKRLCNLTLLKQADVINNFMSRSIDALDLESRRQN